MKSRETELLYFFLAIDLIVLNIILGLLTWYHPQASFSDSHVVRLLFFHANLSWVICYFAFTKKNLFISNGYKNRIWRISKRLLLFCFVALVLAVIIIPKEFSYKLFFEFIVLFFLGKIFVDWLLFYFLTFKRKRDVNTAHVAIIGYDDTGRLMRKIIECNPIMGYKFMGYISSLPDANKNILGHPNQLNELIDKHQIHTIFHSISFFDGKSSERRGKEMLRICNQKGVRFRFIPQSQFWFRNNAKTESVGDLEVIDPQKIPLDSTSCRFQKRAFDILFSTLVILLIVTWLFPILALLIKLNSKGPVFFIQQRTGINNKTFACLKFRSMTVNNQSNELQTYANDTRITRIGRFLRKTSLDEMPQFINVFMGNMSVVGPRPHMLKHTDDYSVLINHYLSRHYIKPGITGWAQIKGYRGETKELCKMEKRVNADMEYVENWSFMWDISIIWQTVFGKSSRSNAV